MRCASLAPGRWEGPARSSPLSEEADSPGRGEWARISRANPRRCAGCNKVIALATGALDKAGAIIYEHTLRPPETQLVSWLERCRVQLESGLTALETITQDRARPTQPDVTVGCVLAYRGIEPLLPATRRSPH